MLWPLSTIGDLFEMGAGKSVTPSARAGERSHPFLRTSNIYWGQVDVSQISTMHFTDQEIEAKALCPGDLLVCEGGDIGRAAIWNGELELCSFQNHLHRLRPKVDNVVSRFVMYYLQAGFTQLNIYEGAGNKTTIPNLSRSRLAALQLPLPPKPEQQKIAAVLWKMQRAIATQDRLIAATRDLKQSAMQHLFTHGLRGEPLKEAQVGPIPSSWLIASLSKVARLERGRFTHRPRNEPRFYGGNTPFVQTGDVVRSQGQITKFTQSLNEEGVSISRVFPAGTILITIAANIGFTGVLTFDSACPDSLVGITPNKAMDTQYLAYYLQLQQPEMDRKAPKGTQKNINIQFLQPWPVVVPDLDEQRAIATALATIDRKLAHHQRKRAALDDLFQTTLHQLMTAQIRVADLDIDTSEVTDHVPDVGNMVGKAAPRHTTS